MASYYVVNNGADSGVVNTETGVYVAAGPYDQMVSQANELNRQNDSGFYAPATIVTPGSAAKGRQTVTPTQAAADNTAAPVTITDASTATADPAITARNLSSGNAEYNQSTQAEKIAIVAQQTGLSPNDPAVLAAVNSANGAEAVNTDNTGQTVSVTGSQNGTDPGSFTDSAQGVAIDPAQQGSVISNFDPSNTRRMVSGLMTGAKMAAADYAGQVFNINFTRTPGIPIAPEQDWRVRVSMRPATAGLFYNNEDNAILKPLAETSGLIFPYTPSVTINHTARYNPQQLTHSNYNSYFYEGSEIQAITIQGEFTVQSQREGRYLMAAIHYMRACTKMFFGASPLAGTPPPMVFLDGYGAPYLPHVPCVVTSFSHTMPAEVDYIEVLVGPEYSGILTRLPTSSTLNITLQPVYSRNNIAKNFTLENFNSGALVRTSTDSTGGFL
jgi:hypothetical protein